MFNRVDGLHAFRGMAILVIVLFHSQGYSVAKQGSAFTAITPSIADAAVHVLFIVSGFVIFWAYSHQLGRPDRAGPYLAKRLARIFPFYWLVLAVYYAGLIMFPVFGRGGEFDLTTVIVSIFLLPSDVDPALYVAWTLKYDLAFWLIFAIAIARPLLGFSLGATAILVGIFYEPVGFYPLSFAIGIGLAWLAKRVRMPPGSWPAPLVLVGEASFSIYLVHTPTIAVAGLILPPSWLLQPQLILISLAAGLITYWLVELPVREIAGGPGAASQALSRCWTPWTSSLAFSKLIGRPNR